MTDADPAKPAGDRDGSRSLLLSAEVYKERFTAAQSSLSTSMLVLAALFAFWLGIENAYEKFKAAERQDHERRTATNEQETFARGSPARLARITIVDPGREDDPSTKAEQAPATNDPTERLLLGLERSIRAELDRRRFEEEGQRRQQAVDERAKSLEALNRDAAKFTVLGVELSAPLALSPFLWLSVLACWLFFVEARRERAVSALACFVWAKRAERPDKPLQPGVAGEAVSWLAPLPAQSQIRCPGEPSIVLDTELRRAVGWDEGTGERRARWLVAAVSLGIAVAALRVAWIAAEITGQFAAEQGFTPSWLIYCGPIAAAMLLLLIVWQAANWASAGAFAVTQDAPKGRRYALSVLGVFVVALFVDHSRLGYVRVARRQLLARAPRFIPDDVQDRRRERRGTTVFTSHHQTLVELTTKWPRRTGMVGVYYARKDKGAVRLAGLGVSGKVARLQPITLDRVEVLEKSRILRPTPTACQWELAALDFLASGEVDKVETACRLLLLGAKLNLHQQSSASCVGEELRKGPRYCRARRRNRRSEDRSCSYSTPSRGRPNLRLFDLLAGLAVRHRSELKRDYLDELAKLIKEQAGEGTLCGSYLQPRLDKWQQPDSKWRRRWTRPEAITWHHPLDPASPDQPRGQRRQASLSIT